MDPPSTPGQPLMVMGRYALFGPLASGGMATVHLGRLLGPAGFSRTVAIKRLHEQFASDPEFVAGFLDEARLAARIRHPNVVPTLDVVATNGQLFLVMEYVEGESVSRLQKTLKKRDAVMPLPIALAVIAGALHGLHAAHEARSEKGEALHLVHRDVSPQNILVGTDGVPRVLDFGVAKAVGRLQTTESGRLKGKVSYMSPEQVRTAEVDRRSDVFAAAIVLWEMLTGKRLFGGDNEAMALDRVMNAEVEAPSVHVQGLPARIDEIVLRALDRDITRRWQTAREMALALEQCTTLASTTQIGSWVEQVAAESLSKRAERVAEVESVTSDVGARAPELLKEIGSSDDATRNLAPMAAPGESGSRSGLISVSASAPPPHPRSRLLVPALFAVAMVLGMGLVFAIASLRDPPAAASAPAAASPAPVAPAPSPVPSTAAPPAPSASAAASAAAPPPPKPKTPVRSNAPDCSVPFLRDELGRKIWKKECL